jgi:signal recognition particle subunit SRP54
MGYMLSLIENVEQTVDKAQADKMAKKLKKGKKFNLQDFAEQLQQMDKMGGMAGLMSKMPGLPNMPAGGLPQGDNGMSVKMLAIIRSMTPRERKHPDLLKASRKRRVAAGSGTQVQDVNRLLKQFLQMQKMLKKFGQNPAKLKSMLQSQSGNRSLF